MSAMFIVRALPGSEGMKRLVAEFDRAWGEKVVRTRDRVRVVQRVGAVRRAARRKPSRV